MSKDGLSENQFKIYELSEGLYKNEKFFHNNVKNFEYIGYLIEKNNIDEIKKKIKYTELRPLFEEEETYDKFKQKIKDIDIKEIVPKKFNNSDEIKKDLTDKKSFYLIKQDYLTKKSGNTKINGNEIKFMFEKDNILLIFSENDKLYIDNKNDGIISESYLNIINKSNSPEDKPENHTYNSKNFPNDNIKYKKDIEILIRIFYYNKYLREKENLSITELKKEEREEIYLIHDSWMKEYKSHFEYKYLEDYLIKKKGI